MHYSKKMFGSAFVFAAAFLCLGHASVYALVNLNIGSGVNATSTTSGSTGVKSSTSLEANTSLEASSSASTSVNGSATADMPAEKVANDSDLEAYAETALRNDESLDDVSFTEDTVTVKYKEKGRFLALVPVTFIVSAKAHADGTLDLEYPWYSFLTLDSKDEVETDLRIAVDNAIREHAVGSVRAEGKPAKLTLSVSERASIAAQMHAILKARLAGKGF